MCKPPENKEEEYDENWQKNVWKPDGKQLKIQLNPRKCLWNYLETIDESTFAENSVENFADIDCDHNAMFAPKAVSVVMEIIVVI